MNEADASKRSENRPKEQAHAGEKRRVYLCDRCGFEMIEQHCKIICPNCGSRWDCSDLSIYTDLPPG